MRMVALAAALATAVTPALSMAASCGPQEVTGSNGACVCKQNYARNAGGQCVAAVQPGETAPGPANGTGGIPKGAIAVGGVVLLVGAAIGIAAGSGGDNDAVPTTSTTGTTPPLN